MPDDRSQPTQACFLIGPPGAPAEMKALYDQAEQQAKGGNDSLAKRLFGLRQNTIKYITLPDAKKKPMIQRILEESDHIVEDDTLRRRVTDRPRFVRRGPQGPGKQLRLHLQGAVDSILGPLRSVAIHGVGIGSL